MAIAAAMLVLLVFVARERQTETSLGLVGLARLLSNFLAQHSGVVPREAQIGIRRIAAERAKRSSATGVIKQKDVSFLALNQREYIQIFRHSGVPPFH